MKITLLYSLRNLWFAIAYFINILCITYLHLQIEAHNKHRIQQTNSFYSKQEQYFKELGLKIPIQKNRNDKCSHLVFKLSSTSSQTSSKSLSPLSNCCINYATTVTSCNLVARLLLIRAHDVFLITFWTQIALVWRQWHACLTSNLSLLSVDIAEHFDYLKR